MCGRYGRRSDKQKIAEAFHVKANLDEIDFMPNDDITPGTMQPVVFSNDEGERDIELMYWGFTFPKRLWSMWNNKAGDSLPTVSVITSEPNEAMAEIHDRQPVILEPRDFAEWLTPSDRPPVQLLRMVPADEMKIELMQAHSMQLPLNSA
jgi:putative SOS response-associated peptidase YedK